MISRPMLQMIATLAALVSTGACAAQPRSDVSLNPPRIDLSRAGILVAVAAHIREEVGEAAGIVGGEVLALSSGNMAPADWEVLRRELPGAAIGALRDFQTNCRLFGCELTVEWWFYVEPPINLGNETVSVRVTTYHRSGSTRQPTAAHGYELILGRSGESWNVVSRRTLWIT